MTSEQGQRAFGPFELVADLEPVGYDAYQSRAQVQEQSHIIALSVEDVFDVAEDHFDLCRALLSHIASKRAFATEALARDEPGIEPMTI